MKNNFCTWKLESDGWTQDYYLTSCNKYHYFGEGTIKGNEYQYCPFCGKKLKL
jgi:hypothetical protein